MSTNDASVPVEDDPNPFFSMLKGMLPGELREFRERLYDTPQQEVHLLLQAIDHLLKVTPEPVQDVDQQPIRQDDAPAAESQEETSTQRRRQRKRTDESIRIG